MIPVGLVEELELERFAVGELERRAAAYIAVGTPTGRRAGLAERRLARGARRRVAELELELARWTSSAAIR